MYLLVGFVSFWVGTMVGFLLKAWMTGRFKDYSGTIYVNKDELSERTVYSLELEDYPETLQFKKVVIFKVDSSD